MIIFYVIIPKKLKKHVVLVVVVSILIPVRCSPTKKLLAEPIEWLFVQPHTFIFNRFFLTWNPVLGLVY